MAFLTENPVWEDGIYQYENTDKLEGGENKIDNWQGQQLANRTAYLKINKADSNNPTFTGVVNVPEKKSLPSDDGTLVATEAQVKTSVDTKAPINNAALTGTPTAPTPAVGTNNTQIATMAAILSNIQAQTNDPGANSALTTGKLLVVYE